MTLRPLRASLPGTLQPSQDRVEQLLVAKGLRQKLHRFVLHRPYGRRPLQIKRAQAREPHIQHQAAGQIRGVRRRTS